MQRKVKVTKSVLRGPRLDFIRENTKVSLNEKRGKNSLMKKMSDKKLKKKLIVFLEFDKI